MAIRVAQIGTGNVGRHALPGILANPLFELTALWVSSEAKADRDAAELAGLTAPTGAIATNDLAKVIDTQPDCAVYTALADNRLPTRWKITGGCSRQVSTSSAAGRCSSSGSGRSSPTT